MKTILLSLTLLAGSLTVCILVTKSCFKEQYISKPANRHILLRKCPIDNA